jgi:hypothetical protein
LNVMRLLTLLGTIAFLSFEDAKARAQEQTTDDLGRVLVVKFLYDPRPARQDVVVFKYPETPGKPADMNYAKRLVGHPGETIIIGDGAMFKAPGPVVERITIEGAKVEITGDTIKIEGGKVEITRKRRP